MIFKDIYFKEKNRVKLRKIYAPEKGRINIEYLEMKKTVRLELDIEACKFLISELQEMLSEENSFVDYDPETGYDCGVLSKNSLGLMIEVREKNS